MAEITIDQKNLEELIERTVQKHIKLSFDDMEELRLSPSAIIVRLETRLESIEKNTATKIDIANLRTELIERIGKLETGQKIMLALFLPMFAAIIALLIKLAFFS